MSANIIRRDQAIADLEAIVDYIAQDRPKTAERFLKATEKAIGFLATMPLVGSVTNFQTPLFRELRVWSIHKFKKFLIFYRPIENGIEVIRIVDGTRNLKALFE